MQKLITTILFCFSPFLIFGQTEINKSFPLNGEEEISLKFEYPQLVKVSVWEKNEVGFKASVLIDDGNQDDKFSFSHESRRGTFYLSSNLDKVDKNENYRIVNEDDEEVIMQRGGKKIIINSDDDANYRNGVEIDIVVEVFVPENLDLKVFAKFGMVEINSIPNSIEVDAQFGGMDLTVNTNELKELDASTAWGQIYTDLDADFEMKGGEGLGKDMIARLSSRGRKRVFLGTKFGNVYLRKQ